MSDKLRQSGLTVHNKDADVGPFKRRPEREAAVLREQLDVDPVKPKYFQLYRYATKIDLLILVVSPTCAVGAGAAPPLMTIVFGHFTGSIGNFFSSRGDLELYRHQLTTLVLYFVYLAIGEFVTIYVSTVGFMYVGEHITEKIREHFLAAILRQNMAFFDMLGSGEVTTRVTADTNVISEGISEKVSLTLTAAVTFVSAFIIGFIYDWKLTLILMSVVFAIILTMSATRLTINWVTKSQGLYAKGSAIVEEALSSIRNVTAFNTQEKLTKQYNSFLMEAETWGRKTQIFLGCLTACTMFIMYLGYALALWQGSKFLVIGKLGLSSIVIILNCIMTGAFALGGVTPNFRSFTSALAAAEKIYSTIDRPSPIDPQSENGDKLDALQGTVELRNVKHIYPSRPDVVVLDDVNLTVPAGKTTAIVGASGSGKSTIIGLIERFYNPVQGAIFLDGHDIKRLNVKWLRHNISLVQQEPILFSTSIEKNIAHGLIGTRHSPEQEELKSMVIKAAKKSNAHEFIMALPEGYRTKVGERGLLLSGGQKQRIAIARALISEPRILLLDEATSALDTKSEDIVQAALDCATEGRTTIVIAHRLSTIRFADNIVVMSKGQIAEQGTHEELLKAKKTYYGLIEAQNIIEIAKAKTMEEDELRILDRQDLQDLAASIDDKSNNVEVDLGNQEQFSRLKRTETENSASSRLEGGSLGKRRHYSLWTLTKFVGGFNRQEWRIMIFGLFCCVIVGGGHPISAIIFAKALSALSLPPPQYDELSSRVNFWSSMFVVLAVIQLLAYAGSGAALGFCSERLIHRARRTTFRALLRQDIQFFDAEENGAGALTTMLSTKTAHVGSLSGATLGTIIQAIVTLVASITLAISIGWKVGLVCTASVPVLLLCGFLRVRMLEQFQERSKLAHASSAGYACEAISAIQTISSLTREQDVWQNYHMQLQHQSSKSLRSILKSSTFYAASQSCQFLCNALGFWYGGTLIANGEYTFFQFMVCFLAVIFGAQSAGTAFSFASEMSKAKNAAAQLKTLFDRVPGIDNMSVKGEKVNGVEGEVEFRNVHFRYPTRPNLPVLRGLDMTVRPGQYVALVGASGCGKSTVISLLERFYDPLVGGVYLDGKDIRSLHIREYKSFLALVSQESALYQGSIRDNVLLGIEREDVSDEEIEKACRDANIYDFIMSLPDGFQSLCGSKGILLSGGQKQRVAIARALIRKPKILLLDEATSALDSRSEKVVQGALDKAARGRTTIAIAHRLSTIQHADVIYVIDQGRITESGTHRELVAKKGHYFELVNLQSLKKVD